MVPTLTIETRVDPAPLVPSVFAPPRCEDCKFWTRHDGAERGWGACGKTLALGCAALYSDSTAVAFGQALGLMDTAVLDTAPDHFCSMFEEKHD